MRAHLDIAHTGTLADEESQRFAFSHDEADVSFLASTFIDMYSDPELACIREYATNAYDAHKAAGNADPIEVFLPTDLRQMYVVRDRGVGMTVDDILNIYTKYGKSTKRDSDTEVGMLGLGCKSALTYTSQFTLIAVKGGVQTTVLVTRDEDGAGIVRIMDTEGTDEPNGVEVSIPVKSVHSFNKRAERFFRFWEPGSVLVNGEAPVPYGAGDGDSVLDPDVILSADLETDFLVMGNVPYPLDDEDDHAVTTGKTYGMVRVPIGSIDFTPSREQPHYTRRTEETIKLAATFIEDAQLRVARSDVDAAPDHREAYKRAARWRDVLYPRYRYNASGRRRAVQRKVALTYRGDSVPSQGWVYPTPDQRLLSWGAPYDYSSKTWALADDHPAGKADYISLDADVDEDGKGKTLHITGYRSKSLQRVTKHKIIKVVEERGWKDIRIVYLYEAPLTTPWVTPDFEVTYEEVRATSVSPVAPSGGKPLPTPYTVLGEYGHMKLAPDLTKTLNLFYLVAGESRHVEKYDLMVSGFFNPSLFTLVWLPANRKKKFLEQHPHALPAGEAIVAAAQAFVDALDPFAALAITRGYDGDEDDNMLARLRRSDGIMDPDLRAVLAGLRDRRRKKDEAQKARTRWDKIERWAHCLGVKDKLPAVGGELTISSPTGAIMQRYPLLRHIAGRYGVGDGEVIDYLNTMYLVREGLLVSRAYI